eukprot:4964666-Amphidinium_carterae.1
MAGRRSAQLPLAHTGHARVTLRKIQRQITTNTEVSKAQKALAVPPAACSQLPRGEARTVGSGEQAKLERRCDPQAVHGELEEADRGVSERADRQLMKETALMASNVTEHSAILDARFSRDNAVSNHNIRTADTL